MRIRSALTIVLVAVSSLRPCAAQVEVTPWIGFYLPSAQLRQEFAWACAQRIDPQTGLDIPDVMTPSRQRNAVAGGARVATWFTRKRGLEGSLGYAPSGWSASGCDGTTAGPTHVMAGSMRMLLRLAPRAKTGAYLLGGLIVVDRAGEAYNVGNTVNPGGVAGVGVRSSIARSVLISGQLEAYLCPGVLGANGGEQFQHDILLSIGSLDPARSSGFVA